MKASELSFKAARSRGWWETPEERECPPSAGRARVCMSLLYDILSGVRTPLESGLVIMWRRPQHQGRVARIPVSIHRLLEPSAIPILSVLHLCKTRILVIQLHLLVDICAAIALFVAFQSVEVSVRVRIQIVVALGVHIVQCCLTFAVSHRKEAFFVIILESFGI